ncbi:WD-40 repeat-containing protein [Calothrix sp. NIES-4105]|nr:WD-40 repeat-containing protein [Calothrix sp. NIES-4105]
MLKTGCEWLNDYLIINPTELQKLEVCQTPAKLKDAAPFLLKAGEAEAKVGNIEKAIATFKTAFKWNPELTKFDPQQKAQEFKNKAEAERLVIDANRFVEEKKIKEAVAAYNQAQKLDPKVEIDANAWAYLCRQGSIYESAKEVMFACEKAVKLDPNNVIIRSVRGFARALTGDYFGAITDFEVYIAQTDDKKYKALMQEYVKVLRTGKNPFTQSELKKLREE